VEVEGILLVDGEPGTSGDDALAADASEPRVFIVGAMLAGVLLNIQPQSSQKSCAALRSVPQAGHGSGGPLSTCTGGGSKTAVSSNPPNSDVPIAVPVLGEVFSCSRMLFASGENVVSAIAGCVFSSVAVAPARSPSLGGSVEAGALIPKSLAHRPPALGGVESGCFVDIVDDSSSSLPSPLPEEESGVRG
jgi:hypothetical protein